MTKKSNKSEIAVQNTRPPTPAENFWFDYADKLPFLSDEHITRFADKLLGLNTAVIAAYIAGIKIVTINLDILLWLPLILFMVSLLSALYSIYPRKANGEFTSITLLQQRYYKGLSKRRRAISLGLVSFVFGIVAGVVVLVI